MIGDCQGVDDRSGKFIASEDNRVPGKFMGDLSWRCGGEKGGEVWGEEERHNYEDHDHAGDHDLDREQHSEIVGESPQFTVSHRSHRFYDEKEGLCPGKGFVFEERIKCMENEGVEPDKQCKSNKINCDLGSR